MQNPAFAAPVPALAPCQPILDRHPLLYLDLTEGVRRGLGRVLYADETAALVGFPQPENPDRFTEFATLCADLDAAKRVFSALPWDQELLFSVHEDFCIPYLESHYPVKPFLGNAFRQVAYLEAQPPSLPAVPFFIAPLTLSHLPQVTAAYRNEEEAYLRQRIQAGVMLGAFDGETLCGFIGIHAEGTTGLLEVLPRYRRRGVASLLQAHMIRRQLHRGEIPFGQVLTDNHPSLALQRSLGMTISQDALYWLTTTEPTPGKEPPYGATDL